MSYYSKRPTKLKLVKLIESLFMELRGWGVWMWSMTSERKQSPDCNPFDMAHKEYTKHCGSVGQTNI